jgi:hypothetical protein
MGKEEASSRGEVRSCECEMRPIRGRVLRSAMRRVGSTLELGESIERRMGPHAPRSFVMRTRAR